MKTMQRAVAMAGLALITSGVFAATAGAASAAPSEESTATTQSAERWRGDGDGNGRGFGDDRFGRRDRSYTVDYFWSKKQCKFRGWVGEVNGRWENPRCYQVDRRTWVLRVEPNHGRRWH